MLQLEATVLSAHFAGIWGLACPPSIGYWEKRGFAALKNDVTTAKKPSVFVPWEDITLMGMAL